MLTAGRRLDRYEIIHQIGAGAFGVVYRARHLDILREDALKVPHHADLARRFLDEARLVARLDHPNIVRLHFMNAEHDPPYIAFELIEGSSLRQRMNEVSGPMDCDEVVEIARQVLAGLAAAHEAGIVHRDLKPENILIAREGTVKVSDFGLGQVTQQMSMLVSRSVSLGGGDALASQLGLSRELGSAVGSSVAGTFAYMAPEQEDGLELDGRADLFALGIMLYELVTGERPRGRFKDPKDLNEAVSPGLNEAIIRALEPRREDRYESARAMGEALAVAQQELAELCRQREAALQEAERRRAEEEREQERRRQEQARAEEEAQRRREEAWELVGKADKCDDPEAGLVFLQKAVALCPEDEEIAERLSTAQQAVAQLRRQREQARQEAERKRAEGAREQERQRQEQARAEAEARRQAPPSHEARSQPQPKPASSPWLPALGILALIIVLGGMGTCAVVGVLGRAAHQATEQATARETTGSSSGQAATPRTSDWPPGPGSRAGEEIVGPEGIKFVWVPGGSFMMGSDDYDDEKPVHRVELSGFWIGKTEVTVAQWRSVMGSVPDGQQGDDHPVVYVSWNDAKAFCDKLGLQLPTEAQWEYTARGPDSRKYPWGSDWDKAKCCNLENQGPGGRTFPVGGFPSGASWCGALDMAGNVWEWCADWYDSGYYASSPDRNPPGPSSGDYRVLRGGSWLGNPDSCRSASRLGGGPTLTRGAGGFRVARS